MMQTAFIFSSLLLMAGFQNCSKVAVSELQAPQSKAAVQATDDVTKQSLPVEVVDDTEAITPDMPKSDDGTKSPVADHRDDEGQKNCDRDKEKDKDPVKDEIKRQLAENCGYDTKSIDRIVDIAQYEGQDVRLEVVKGKTLIYSSKDNVSVKSLNVGTAVGRTILCGVTVDELNIKKGRLELYHSEIKKMGERKGNVICDSHSKLPRST